MKVIIDIPNDFTGDYIADKFKDFFSRVIADIDCKGMCGRYEKEIAEMFLKVFDDSEEKISCNCKHNSNSRDDEPCCRCDSRIANMLDIINHKIIESKDFIKEDYTDIRKTIKHFECVKNDAEMTLNQGVCIHFKEINLIYKRRKRYAELAISALKKQMPKKVLSTQDKKFALCPCCGKGLIDK